MNKQLNTETMKTTKRNKMKEWAEFHKMPALNMNDVTYKLRRRVMAFIYEAKKLADFDRVDIRITENSKDGCLGLAAMAGGKSKGHAILIPIESVNMNDDKLRHIVFHELLHATRNINHDDNCPLMQPALNSKTNRELVHNTFVKYF